MGASDWIAPSNSLVSPVVLSGATKATQPPNGGGGFVFGFHSIVSTSGCAALRNNFAGFNPAPSGVTIQAAMKRGETLISGGFAPLIFVSLQSDDITDQAYVLGLSDAENSHITLLKASPSAGVPDSPVGHDGVLARSSVTYLSDTWIYLQLNAFVEDSGDVLLQVRTSDLSMIPLGLPPAWVAVPGIDDVVDPVGGAFSSGYSGFGMRNEANADKFSFFDEISIYRQVV